MNNIARGGLLYLKNASHDIWGGLGLETFGADFELVKQLPATHVRTVVDGGDTADQWILTGIHTVNRVCYLVTEAPHDWEEIEFRIPASGRLPGGGFDNPLNLYFPAGFRQMRAGDTPTPRVTFMMVSRRGFTRVRSGGQTVQSFFYVANDLHGNFPGHRGYEGS